jgi:hypothetical protein
MLLIKMLLKESARGVVGPVALRLPALQGAGLAFAHRSQP